MTRRMLIVRLAAAALLAGAAPAAAQVQPSNDFGGFHDVLPPGANGRSNLIDLARSSARGQAAAQRRSARHVRPPRRRSAARWARSVEGHRRHRDGRDAACAKAGRPGDQACYDKIVFRATGGITQPMIGSQNRPTYQLAVEVQGHRPR